MNPISAPPPGRRSRPGNPETATSTPPRVTHESSRLADMVTVCDQGPCWRCQPPEPPLVEKRLDAWRQTVLHLAAAGLPAAVPADTLAALCARGGRDRAVAHTAQAVTA